MSPPIASGQSESGKARFAGSASSGILELIIFHPVDTVAKRLMSNQTKVQYGFRQSKNYLISFI
jgi:hypothetical protein